MKSTLNTTTRSSLTLLIILLATGLTGLLVQSCSLPVDRAAADRQLALENFELAVRSAKPDLQTFAEEQRLLRAKMGSVSYSDKVADELEAQKLMQPLLNSSEALLTSYGFSGSDFENSELDLDDPATIYLSFAILRMEQMEVEQASIIKTIWIYLSGNTNAASEFWDCALEALGLEVAIEIFRIKSLETISGKKRMIKLIGKIGARYLGYIGVAVATYDFIDCMWIE